MTAVHSGVLRKRVLTRFSLVCVTTVPGGEGDAAAAAAAAEAAALEAALAASRVEQENIEREAKGLPPLPVPALPDEYAATQVRSHARACVSKRVLRGGGEEESGGGGGMARNR